MLHGSQLKDALIEAGYEPPEPKRPRKGKKFFCKKCKTEMINPDWGNVMWCPNCEKEVSYFIFTKERD